MANLTSWRKGNDKDNLPFDPKKIDPPSVRFDNTRKHWKMTFR